MVDTLPLVDSSVDSLWLSVADVAKRKGVSRQAVSKRVRKLTADGLLSTRSGKGGSVLVDLAAFDRATNETTFAAPVIAPPVEAPSPYSEKLRYEAALKRLDLDERLKKLVPADALSAAAQTVGHVIVEALSMYVSAAVEIEEAARTQGQAGVRRVLRAIEHKVRARMAASLQAIAESPAALAVVELDMDEEDQS